MRSSYCFIIFIYLLLISCSDSNEVNTPTVENSCRVVNFSPATFYYDRQYLFGSISPFVFNPDFNGITFEYNSENQLSYMTGGIIPLPPGQAVQGLIYSNDIIYDFTYNGNTITSTKSFTWNDITYDSVYVLDSNNRIVSRELRGQLYNLSEVSQYNYVYLENTIEEYIGTSLYRTFFIENGNLVKVEQRFYNMEQELSGKKDILFSDHDDRQNFLKDKYFIDGNFYNAFSNNNFQRLELITYNYDGNDFIPSAFGENFVQYTFSENEEGIASIFTIECDE